MNPFTRYLSQWSNNHSFSDFIGYWDRLERVVIEVYRQKTDVASAAPEFDEVWPWLREQYREWQDALRPYWQATRAAKQPTRTDPFRLLLDISNPTEIIGDWRAMQHLPAAREAINRYLVDNS